MARPCWGCGAQFEPLEPHHRLCQACIRAHVRLPRVRPQRTSRIQRQLGEDVWDAMTQLCDVSWWADDPAMRVLAERATAWLKAHPPTAAAHTPGGGR
jgi:hypothetical protein